MLWTQQQALHKTLDRSEFNAKVPLSAIGRVLRIAWTKTDNAGETDSRTAVRTEQAATRLLVPDGQNKRRFHSLFIGEDAVADVSHCHVVNEASFYQYVRGIATRIAARAPSFRKPMSFSIVRPRLR